MAIVLLPIETSSSRERENWYLVCIVDLSVEHVRVKLPVTRIDPTRVWLEQTECKCFGSWITLVSEERVGVDGEGRLGIPPKR